MQLFVLDCLLGKCFKSALVALRVQCYSMSACRSGFFVRLLHTTSLDFLNVMSHALFPITFLMFLVKMLPSISPSHAQTVNSYNSPDFQIVLGSCLRLTSCTSLTNPKKPCYNNIWNTACRRPQRYREARYLDLPGINRRQLVGMLSKFL